MNPKFVWCIECEAWVECATFPVFGEVHQISYPVYGDNILKTQEGKEVRYEPEVIGADSDLCYFQGGFSFSEPPELPVDWVEHVTPPGDDELLVMDVLSLELKQEATA